MSFRPHLYIIALAIAAAPGVAFAQDATPPCRSISESMLAQFIGDWMVDWEYRTAPGEFARSTARATIAPDLAGCAVVEHFDGTLRGVPFSAVTMISHPGDDEFDRVRIDSEHGSFTRSSGHAAGDSIVFLQERPMGERVLRTRHCFFADGDGFTVEFFLSRALDSPWELVHRARYRRAD